jgi:predicted regulator of Ras-like GTPase activity (Roadblock/LC7/MglB family)
MFDTMITEMLEKIPGALGATLFGVDGLPVACCTPQGRRHDTEMGDELWEAASIDLLRTIIDIQKATKRLDAGGLDQVSIQMAAFTLLMRPLSPDYVLVLALENQVWAGKGRYIMRLLGDEMRQELA